MTPEPLRFAPDTTPSILHADSTDSRSEADILSEIVELETKLDILNLDLYQKRMRSMLRTSPTTASSSGKDQDLINPILSSVPQSKKVYLLHSTTIPPWLLRPVHVFQEIVVDTKEYPAVKDTIVQTALLSDDIFDSLCERLKEFLLGWHAIAFLPQKLSSAILQDGSTDKTMEELLDK
jgi:hypothetical protein